jgi:hypothetical protein
LPSLGRDGTSRGKAAGSSLGGTPKGPAHLWGGLKQPCPLQLGTVEHSYSSSLSNSFQGRKKTLLALQLVLKKTWGTSSTPQQVTLWWSQFFVGACEKATRDAPELDVRRPGAIARGTSVDVFIASGGREPAMTPAILWGSWSQAINCQLFLLGGRPTPPPY